MDKFEYVSYTAIYYHEPYKKHMDFLNEMGSQGWELVTVMIKEIRTGHTTDTIDQYTTYWKRKIELTRDLRFGVK
jgi:hypothetical protein